MNLLVANALLFAMRAHESIDQRRKFTNRPYIEHPMAVANILSSAREVTPEMYAAAYLHDVVEDTPVTLEEVRSVFGEEVARLVEELTDPIYPVGDNRATRKAKNLLRLADISPEAQTIKLADIIDNNRDIIKDAPKFAKVYLPESKAKLQVLGRGDPGLQRWAYAVVEEGLHNLQSL